MVKIGQKAPEFAASASNGQTLQLKDFHGKTVVLYFYPKDDTPGCTKEACAFRDNYQAFSNKNAIILGVSKDPLSKHEKFIKKYELPFMLLSDETGELCQAYETWVEKNMYGRQYMGIERATFVIGPDGVIKALWRKVKVPGHVEEVLASL